MGLAVDLDRMRVGEAAAAVDEFDAGVLQQADIDAVQPVDLAVLVGDELRPAEGRELRIPAIGAGVLEIVAVVRGVDQQLLRDVAADRSEEGRVGKEGVSTCRYRGWP